MEQNHNKDEQNYSYVKKKKVDKPHGIERAKQTQNSAYSTTQSL